MPYTVKGNTVYKHGKVVGHSSNPAAYVRTLRAVEHGWKPTGKGKKRGLKCKGRRLHHGGSGSRIPSALRG